MAKKTALIVIDCQVDFHPLPGSALGVPGAIEDTQRTCAFINKVPLDSIFASQDTHYILDISHKAWFNKPDGTPVDDFTFITDEDLEQGRYTARIDPNYTLQYLKNLKADGEFTHTIWPDHCINGTPGHAFHPDFSKALNGWMARKKTWVTFMRKGENPYTEHYGVFRANVPIQADPSTNINDQIFRTLNQHDLIYFAGQARTHCDINSLMQLVKTAPQLAPKVVVLEDCMSNVVGLPDDFYNHVDSLYASAKAQGVQFARSTDI